jgi:hypothetical protein
MEQKKDKAQIQRETYEKLQKKYSLPGFDELNREFEIERLKSSSFLLKDIRRNMIEKISSVIKLLEMMMNPTAAPIFMFAVLKNIKADTKKQIETLYKELTSVTITMVRLDISFDEKAEADAIKNIFKKWNSNKPQIIGICNSMEDAWKESSKKSEKSYLG